MKKTFAVLCSGFGSNLQALINAVREGAIPAKICVVIADNKKAYAVTRAQKAGIPVEIVLRQDFDSRSAFENAIRAILARHRAEYIVLAGFMRVLSPAFVRKYPRKIVNIHPALLPSFKGTHGIRDAFSYGVKVTGVTVHFVDEHVDHGPIIMQETVPVKDRETEEALERKIHRIEHILYPRCVALLTKGKLIMRGRKVYVKR